MSEPVLNSSPEPRWMIYGANGYTGKLCAEEAHRRGLRPVLAGRNAGALKAVADPLGLHVRVFNLDDPQLASTHLRDIKAVLNCAGPFSSTALPLLEACVRGKTHYLDITGEIGVFESLFQREAQWQRAGIAVLPGAGFDVVPTDCLAAMLKQALPDTKQLRLAIHARGGRISAGTAKTAIEGLGKGCCVRMDGQLVKLPAGSQVREFPFPSGVARAVAIPWGDIATSYRTTRIPNIETYMVVSDRQLRSMKLARLGGPIVRWRWVQERMKRRAEKRFRGPSEEARRKGRVEIYGEVENATGERRSMTMQTPEGYAFTAVAAVEATQRVIAGDVAPGATTPALAFGADFVLAFEGVESSEMIGPQFGR